MEDIKKILFVIFFVCCLVLYANLVNFGIFANPDCFKKNNPDDNNSYNNAYEEKKYFDYLKNGDYFSDSFRLLEFAKQHSALILSNLQNIDNPDSELKMLFSADEKLKTGGVTSSYKNSVEDISVVIPDNQIKYDTSQADVDKNSFNETQKKLSTQLLSKVNQSYSNLHPDNLITKNQPAEPSLRTLKSSAQKNSLSSANSPLHVYVHTYPKFSTEIIDSHVIEVTNRDEENNLAVAWVNAENLMDIAGLRGVRSVSEVIAPNINTGLVTTEGDFVHKTEDVRLDYGYYGEGLNIGIISDGVDNINSSIASGDIPADVGVLRNTMGGDEGTAMLEIVHDMVPYARLFFHDCGSSTLEFNQAIDSLFSNGCTIICDDINWLTEPFFEDGIIASHVAELLSENELIYVTSATNVAERHYQGDFYERGDNFHDFSSGTSEDRKSLYVNIPSGSGVWVVLEWNDKFGNSENDYDLYLSDSSPGDLAISANFQNGTQDPIEYITYTNTGSSSVTGIIDVQKISGDAKILEIFIYPRGETTVYNNNIVARDSVYGHGAVCDVVTVAAVDWITPETIEPYSSHGPSTISWPEDEIRPKPDITGVDNVSITGAGGFSNPFSGTSASAPHIAAVAAQIWGAHPDFSAEQVRTALYYSAIDLGDSGRDNIFGYGRADALLMEELSEGPQADFDYSAIPFGDSYKILFSDNSSGIQITGWEWSFGDGEISTDENPEHTYEESGYYEAVLTVTNSFGLSDTLSKEVRIPTVSKNCTFKINGTVISADVVIIDKSLAESNGTIVTMSDLGDVITLTGQGLNGWESIIYNTDNAVNTSSAITASIINITATTKPLSAHLSGDTGAIEFSITLNFDSPYPENALIQQNILQRTPEAIKYAFVKTASDNGLIVYDIAYLTDILKENFVNADSAVINMAVGADWVIRHLGKSPSEVSDAGSYITEKKDEIEKKIRILRYADDGTAHILKTSYVSYDGQKVYFKAVSPDGLCAFGLVALDSIYAPAKSGSDRDFTQKPTELPVLKREVNVGGDSHITKIEATGTGISSLVVTGLKKQSPGSGVVPPSSVVYEYIELVPAGYVTIKDCQITFDLPVIWVQKNNISPRDVSLFHYNNTFNNTGTNSKNTNKYTNSKENGWTALFTVPVTTKNGMITYTAQSPGFSLFAIAKNSGDKISEYKNSEYNDNQSYDDLKTDENNSEFDNSKLSETGNYLFSEQKQTSAFLDSDIKTDENTKISGVSLKDILIIDAIILVFIVMAIFIVKRRR